MSRRQGWYVYVGAASLAAACVFQFDLGRPRLARAAERSARSKPRQEPDWDYRFEDAAAERAARAAERSARAKSSNHDPNWNSQFEDAADVENDLLAKVIEQNSDDYPQPPAPVRRGSVTVSSAAHLPIDSQSRGRVGVQVGSGQAILSPAAANGKVFVGGGFTSHEFYCLNSQSGRLLWDAHLSDPGPSAPSYDRGTLLFTTESCTCYALDAETGRGLWSIWLGDPVITAPTIAGDRVLVCYPGQAARVSRPKAAKRTIYAQASTPTPAGQPPALAQPTKPQPTEFVFAARRLRSGKPMWQKWIDGHVISAPVVYGKDVYIVTFAGTLYKFRLSDGEILMARQCRSTSAPVVLADGIYLTRRVDDRQGGIPQECMIKLDRITGRQRYAAQTWDAPHLAGPAGQKDLTMTIDSATESTSATESQSPGRSLQRGGASPDDPDYQPGGDSHASTRQNPWSSFQLVGRSSAQELQAFCGSRMAAFDGRLFNCMGSEIVATDAATGRRRWGLTLDEPWIHGDFSEPVAVPPAVADGKLFIASRAGQLLCVEGETGKVLGRIELGAPAASQPIIEGGRIFVGTTRGELVLIKTTNPNLTGWNQWGGDAAHSGVAQRATAAKGALALQ